MNGDNRTSSPLLGSKQKKDIHSDIFFVQSVRRRMRSGGPRVMRRPEWNGEDRTSSPLLGSKQKKISIRISFFVQSARRGSNPRPPPWQGGAPPLSHSRMLCKHLIQFEKEERETGIEPATPSLARRCSTAEPLAHILTTVDSISSEKQFVNNKFDFYIIFYIFLLSQFIHFSSLH